MASKSSSQKTGNARRITRANPRIVPDSDDENNVTVPAEEKTALPDVIINKPTLEQAIRKPAHMTSGGKAPRRPPGLRVPEIAVTIEKELIKRKAPPTPILEPTTKRARQGLPIASEKEASPPASLVSMGKQKQQPSQDPLLSRHASEVSLDDVSMFFEEGHPPTPHAFGDSDDDEATDYVGHDSDVDSNGNFKDEYEDDKDEQQFVHLYTREEMARVMPQLNSFYDLNNNKPNILKNHLETAAKGLLKAEEQERQKKQVQAALELQRAAQHSQIPTPPASQTSGNVVGSPGGSSDQVGGPSLASLKKMFDVLKDLGHDVPEKYLHLYNAAQASPPVSDTMPQLEAKSQKQPPNVKLPSQEAKTAPQAVLPGKPRRSHLEGCEVTNHSPKDRLLIPTYTNDLAKLIFRPIVTRYTLRLGNFSILQSDYFPTVNMARMIDVVTFQSNTARNLYNVSRSNPNMFKTVLAGSQALSNVLTPRLPGNQFAAGLVMFAFMIKAKLLTPTFYTDNAGKVKSNTNIQVVQLCCESQRAFSVLAQHLDKNGTGLHVHTLDGNLVLGTARAEVEAEGGPITTLDDDFFTTDPTTSAEGAAATYPAPPLEYRIHWGADKIPVWDASRYFQTGTDGYTGSDFDVARLLTMPYRDPLWMNEEVPAGTFCAVHYVASSYKKDGRQSLTLNLAGVQILAKRKKEL